MSLEERIEGCAGCGRLLIFGDSCLGCDVVEVLIKTEKAKAVKKALESVRLEQEEDPPRTYNKAVVILNAKIDKLLEDKGSK